MEWLLHLVQLRKEPASFPFMSSSSLGWSERCSHAGKGAPVKCLFPNSSMLVTQQCSSVSQDNSKKGGKKRKWLVTVSVWGLVPQRHALELNQRQAIAPLMALLSRGHISSCEKRLIFRQKHKQKFYSGSPSVTGIFQNVFLPIQEVEIVKKCSDIHWKKSIKEFYKLAS